MSDLQFGSTIIDADATSAVARAAIDEVYLGLEPLWIGGSSHRDRRVDVFLDEEGETYHVLSLAIDGVFVPETISCRAHVPYDTDLVDQRPPREDATGVFVSLEPIYSTAERARFVHDGVEREADVVAATAVLVTWDVPWLRDRPVPIALLIEGQWVAPVASVVAATAADFGACYARCKDSRDVEDDWAASSFYHDPTYEERIAMVESVLDTPGLSNFASGCLAAGPIEDLIGHRFLDYVMRDARNRERYIPLLRQTYWHNEPVDIQARMRSILGEP